MQFVFHLRPSPDHYYYYLAFCEFSFGPVIIISLLVRGTIVVFGCLVLSDLVRFFCRQIFSGFSLVSFSSHQY